MISIDNEFAPLQKVILGRATPYQRDKEQVAGEMQEFPFVPDTDRRAEVLALTYPTESILEREYANFVAVLENHGVEVLLADPAASYSFDYTCPRDIGFVVGDLFFVANMAVASRATEIETIHHHLSGIDSDHIIRAPSNCLLEGGDIVLLDRHTVLGGYNRRSNRAGIDYLGAHLEPLGIRVIPVKHNQLHLDCCLNPLGGGHLLIHPESLAGNDDAVWQALDTLPWVRVDSKEREYLATNVLSINPDTIIARDHDACARVNRELRQLGYGVEAIGFDGVPATGGSFRCASLPLIRRSES